MYCYYQYKADNDDQLQASHGELVALYGTLENLACLSFGD